MKRVRETRGKEGGRGGEESEDKKKKNTSVSNIVTSYCPLSLLSKILSHSSKNRIASLIFASLYHMSKYINEFHSLSPFPLFLPSPS